MHQTQLFWVVRYWVVLKLKTRLQLEVGGGNEATLNLQMHFAFFWSLYGIPETDTHSPHLLLVIYHASGVNRHPLGREGLRWKAPRRMVLVELWLHHL